MLVVALSLWLLCCVAGCCLAQCDSALPVIESHCHCLMQDLIGCKVAINIDRSRNSCNITKLGGAIMKPKTRYKFLPSK